MACGLVERVFFSRRPSFPSLGRAGRPLGHTPASCMSPEAILGVARPATLRPSLLRVRRPSADRAPALEPGGVAAAPCLGSGIEAKAKVPNGLAGGPHGRKPASCNAGAVLAQQQLFYTRPVRRAPWLSPAS